MKPINLALIVMVGLFAAITAISTVFGITIQAWEIGPPKLIIAAVLSTWFISLCAMSSRDWAATLVCLVGFGTFLLGQSLHPATVTWYANALLSLVMCVRITMVLLNNIRCKSG